MREKSTDVAVDVDGDNDDDDQEHGGRQVVEERVGGNIYPTSTGKNEKYLTICQIE